MTLSAKMDRRRTQEENQWAGKL